MGEGIALGRGRGCAPADCRRHRPRQSEVEPTFPRGTHKRAVFVIDLAKTFGHDEEVAGIRGAKAIVALLASRDVRLDYVIDEGLLITDGIIKGLDKPAALIGLAEKGYATLVMTAHATPGHSSMPPRETAIGMMSAALARLEDHRLPMQVRSAVAQMFDTLAP